MTSPRHRWLASLGGGTLWLLWLGVASPSCVIDDISLAGKACDTEDDVCAEGFVCNTKTNVCVADSTKVCADPGDCEALERECRERGCGDDGVCALVDRVEVGQLLGDCLTRTCAGGALSAEPSPDDTFDDGNPCTVDACAAGQRSHEPAAAGEPCPTGVCDGAGACVECVSGLVPCGGTGVCVGGQCVDAGCVDGAASGQETDVDCGGPACAPCPPAAGCSAASDCQSGVCDLAAPCGVATGCCVAPACDDGVRNGAESDVDCGGDTCAPCGLEEACAADADCASGKCKSGAVCASTCENHAMDALQGETDVDCGGSQCSRCVGGQKCLSDADCETGRCCEAEDGRRCSAYTCPGE